MQNTDAVNETIRGIEPGAEFQWVDDDELRRMTTAGWRLIGAVMEKRFVSKLPGYGVPAVVCVECQNPVQEIHDSFPRKYQRSTTCTLVEVARFLVVRSPDDVIAELNVKLEEARGYSQEKAAAAAEAARELKEARASLASAKEELERATDNWEYYKGQTIDARVQQRLAEAVIGRARDELGAARWRELVGDLEHPEDPDSQDHEGT